MVNIWLKSLLFIKETTFHLIISPLYSNTATLWKGCGNWTNGDILGYRYGLCWLPFKQTISICANEFCSVSVTTMISTYLEFCWIGSTAIVVLFNLDFRRQLLQIFNRRGSKFIWRTQHDVVELGYSKLEFNLFICLKLQVHFPLLELDDWCNLSLYPCSFSST